MRVHMCMFFSEITTTLFKSYHPVMIGLSEFPSSKMHFNFPNGQEGSVSMCEDQTSPQ